MPRRYVGSSSSRYACFSVIYVVLAVCLCVFAFSTQLHGTLFEAAEARYLYKLFSNTLQKPSGAAAYLTADASGTRCAARRPRFPSPAKLEPARERWHHSRRAPRSRPEDNEHLGRSAGGAVLTAAGPAAAAAAGPGPAPPAAERTDGGRGVGVRFLAACPFHPLDMHKWLLRCCVFRPRAL